MKQTSLAVLAFLLVACGAPEPSTDRPSSSPVSVRGWIADVDKGTEDNAFRTVETERARRIAMFQQTSIWVENISYVSGGVGETGAFVLLDVPPGNVVVGFNAPGAETAKLPLENVPPYADVLVPGLVLKNGGSTVEDPSKIQVRVPGDVTQPRRTNLTAKVAGHVVPVIEVPLTALTDRQNYPEAPVVGFAPPVTVK